MRGTGCKFESSADAELSNSSNGADAPAAAFGKTACADFASAGYKIKMNKAEMNQSEMNAAPSGRKKYPWTLKRVLAWVLIAALVSMYLVTFVLSLSSSPAAGTAFRASLLLTIALPVIAWIFIWAVGALQHRTSIASLKLLNSNPQARKEMEEAVQESEKREENNTSKSK